jgi:hypothetical protein
LPSRGNGSAVQPSYPSTRKRSPCSKRKAGRQGFPSDPSRRGRSACRCHPSRSLPVSHASDAAPWRPVAATARVSESRARVSRGTSSVPRIVRVLGLPEEGQPR